MSHIAGSSIGPRLAVAHRRGRRATASLVASAALGAVATACGSSAPATSSPTAAQTSAAASTPTAQAPAATSAPAQSTSGLDACVVGKWTATSINISTATGGAGTVMTINPDGSSTVDVSAGAPITGSISGHTYSSKGSGTGTLHFASISGGHASIDTQDFTTVTYTRTKDGAPMAGGTNPKNAVGQAVTYTCSSSALVINDPANGTVYNFSH